MQTLSQMKIRFREVILKLGFSADILCCLCFTVTTCVHFVYSFQYISKKSLNLTAEDRVTNQNCGTMFDSMTKLECVAIR